MPVEQLQRLPSDASLSRFGRTFCPGDKVMQVENDYDKDVYNGDNGDLRRRVATSENGRPGGGNVVGASAVAGTYRLPSALSRNTGSHASFT